MGETEKKNDRCWWTDGKYVVSLGPHRSGERTRWRVRGYAIGHHGEARWRYERTYQGALALAASLKEAWLHGLADVERPLPPPRTIVDLGQAWLERDAYSEKTGKPWSRSSVNLRQGILDNLYKICGSARSPRTVTSQDVYRACDAQSSSRQYGSWCALRRLFAWALERGFVAKNPADTKQARRYYRPGPGLEPITEAQLGKMLDATDGREAHDILMVLAFTGMRVGELVQWRHGWITRTTQGYWIDIPESQAGESGHAWEPKSTHGARCIPMVPEVWAAYLSTCERWGVNPHNAPKDWVVFPGATAVDKERRIMTRPRAVGSVYEMVVRAGKAAGIEQRVHPHTLRHLFGSMALDRGTPYPVISAVMGHSSVAVTEGIYARHTKRTLCASLINHLGGAAGELRVPEPVPLFPAGVTSVLEGRDGQPVDNETLRRLRNVGTPTGHRVPRAEVIDPADVPSWMDDTSFAPASYAPPTGHKGAAAPSSSPARNEGPEGAVLRPVFQPEEEQAEAVQDQAVAGDPVFTAKLSRTPVFVGDPTDCIRRRKLDECCAAAAGLHQKSGTRGGPHSAANAKNSTKRRS